MTALRDRPVTVVGAGIGGLTAALALARRGARVMVLERAGQFREVGAGIQVSPNAARVLDALGLAADFTAVSTPSHAVELRDGRGGDLVARLDLLRHRPQAMFRTVRRARLLDVLDRAARDAGVTIRLGHAVSDLPDAPLLIGADGLHSRVRAALNGPQAPFFTGQVAWRALIPLESRARPVSQVFMGPGRHLVSYPLADGLRNLVAVEERSAWTAEDWSQTDDPDHLRAAFRGFRRAGAGLAGAGGRLRDLGAFRSSGRAALARRHAGDSGRRGASDAAVPRARGVHGDRGCLGAGRLP